MPHTDFSQMATNTLYDLKFAGNPTNNAERLKTLAHGGPLVVAMDHRLTAMMPGAFDDAPEGGKTVCMADLDHRNALQVLDVPNRDHV